jgi:hypothetical protein
MKIRSFVLALMCVITGCMCRAPAVAPLGPPAPDAGDLLGVPWGLGIARGHTDIVDVPNSIQQVLYPLDTWQLGIGVASPHGSTDVLAADFFSRQPSLEMDAEANAVSDSTNEPP